MQTKLSLKQLTIKEETNREVNPLNNQLQRKANILQRVNLHGFTPVEVHKN
jgi:hypothetical protein